jgi:myo-inositol-1(or 4)-monophosphatase
MNQNLMKEFLGTGVTAARLAGDIILNNLGHLSTSDIQSKQSFDFVTKVDRWSETVIMQTIRDRFPSHAFLAEETLKQEDRENYRWIIDPLDGTTNYIHGFPAFSVSIALEYQEEMIVGVVYDPLKDELFHAIRGNGSFLNNKRITVSDLSALQSSLIATGFPFRKKDTIDLYLRAFKEIFDSVSDLRRAGSAALDFAYVASGRCDGFFELNLSPWDVAAGSLLIQEAGGTMTDFGGGGDFLSTGNIVAGNKYVHRELLKIVRKVFKGTVDQ